jgi:uncharacterized protein (DUF1697 family)
MDAFRALLVEMGFDRARTYIQTGNALFLSDQPAGVMAARIADGVLARFGFRPPVLMRSLGEMRAALALCPFREMPGEKVYCHFAERDFPPDTGGFLTALAGPDEAFFFRGNTLWLSLPSGTGRSKLADRVGRLPVEMTARNRKTVTALIALGERLAAS